MRFVITWSARCITAYTCKGPDAFDKTSSEISLIPAVNKDVEERKHARELSSLEAARVAEYAAFYTAILFLPFCRQPGRDLCVKIIVHKKS